MMQNPVQTRFSLIHYAPKRGPVATNDYVIENRNHTSNRALSHHWSLGLDCLNRHIIHPKILFLIDYAPRGVGHF